MGVSGFQLGHGHGAVDHGFDLALAVQAGQLGHHGGVGLGFTSGEVTPEHPDDGRAFEQGQVEGQGGDGPGRKTDHQVTATPGDGAEGGLGEITTHGVISHVRAFAVGQAFDGFAQLAGVQAAVVDGGVGADGRAQRAFVVG